MQVDNVRCFIKKYYTIRLRIDRSNPKGITKELMRKCMQEIAEEVDEDRGPTLEMIVEKVAEEKWIKDTTKW